MFRAVGLQRHRSLSWVVKLVRRLLFVERRFN